MTFEEAFNSLRDRGAKTIPFKSQGADYIDVWASELMSGKRKGERVIRIQWGNSSSTLDHDQWNDSKKILLMRNVQLAIESVLQ